MNIYLKSLIIIFSVFILFDGHTLAQRSKYKTQIKEEAANSYPIAGSDLLKDRYLKVEQFLKDNPGYFEQQKLKKTAAWNFTVGSTKNWTAIDFTTNNEYSVASTCRAVGENCYVFVANDVWGVSVDSNAVAAVVKDFDKQTPADPNKGIFQTDVDTFGDPPDVDNDPRIIILILDIKDGYTGNSGYVAGYFSPDNEIRPTGAAEIYFMDANPTDLKTPGGLNNALTTAAHEFQHMINFKYHYNFLKGQSNPEMTFVNEGLSMAAEVVCGYGVSMQDKFAAEPNHYLFDWRSGDLNLSLNDYARAQRFFLYLMEQFGVGILKQTVMDYKNLGLVGNAALNKILSQNYSISLGQVFLNWEIANGLNNINVNSAYGYSTQSIPITTGTTFYNPNVSLTSSTLQMFGAEYFTFTNSSDLNITFTSTGSNIVVKALEIGAGTSRVVDVPINTPFNEPDYPSVYNTIRFAAIDTNQTTSQPYQYQSSGTVISTVTELKWDETEPTGYYLWSSADTLCVTFNAFPGGTLDSIRVALRRAGTIRCGIWEFTGTQVPTPLGNQLAFPINASIATDAQIVNSGGKYPYNIPYTNWSTVDLKSYNISTDKPFAVGFVIGKDPATPGVMATDLKSSGSYHSYTYLQTSDQVSSPGWYYITSNDAGDSIAIYLVRAYVSLVTGIVKQDIELAPTIYSLSQNYPNPFNPSTTIEFQVAKDGFVSLKVYDILGNEVKTLVSESMNKGRYNAVFDASGLSSGIYFYKLQTDGYTAVKKLMLLK
jgi:hypothetical protein